MLCSNVNIDNNKYKLKTALSDSFKEVIRLFLSDNLNLNLSLFRICV